MKSLDPDWSSPYIELQFKKWRVSLSEQACGRILYEISSKEYLCSTIRHELEGFIGRCLLDDGLVLICNRIQVGLAKLMMNCHVEDETVVWTRIDESFSWLEQFVIDEEDTRRAITVHETRRTSATTAASVKHHREYNYEHGQRVSGAMILTMILLGILVMVTCAAITIGIMNLITTRSLFG